MSRKGTGNSSSIKVDPRDKPMNSSGAADHEQFIQALREQIKELNETLRKRDLSIDQYRTKLKNHRRQLESTEKTLAATLSTKKSERGAKRDGIANQLRKKLEGLEAQINEFKANEEYLLGKIERLEEKNSTLLAQISKDSEETEDEAELRDHKHEIASLKSDKTVLESQIQALKEQIDQLTSNLTTQKQEFDTEIDKLKKEKLTDKFEVKRQQLRIKELHGKISASDSQTTKLQQELATLKDTIKKLNNKLKLTGNQARIYFERKEFYKRLFQENNPSASASTPSPTMRKPPLSRPNNYPDYGLSSPTSSLNSPKIKKSSLKRKRTKGDELSPSSKVKRVRFIDEEASLSKRSMDKARQPLPPLDHAQPRSSLPLSSPSSPVATTASIPVSQQLQLATATYQRMRRTMMMSMAPIVPLSTVAQQQQMQYLSALAAQQTLYNYPRVPIGAVGRQVSFFPSNPLQQQPFAQVPGLPNSGQTDPRQEGPAFKRRRTT